MDINIRSEDHAKVVTLMGDIDGSTAPYAQEQILSLVQSEPRIALDMTGVPYMSSAGLRMLLSIYRQVAGRDGRVVLVGLREEIKDTMEITGFLSFFTVCDTLDEGLKALGQ